MKGFSRRNLELMRQWYLFWNGAAPEFAQQPVSPILAIPWGHNLAIIAKCLEKSLRHKLPSIEQIERELGMDGGTEPAKAGRAGV